ncbi:hypothetical protein B0H13DRAFT_2098177 [Mycena leptocephala]|nr:hypothetical protein B0H13DRAFT_2098177 [Mycena leptocephala]
MLWLGFGFGGWRARGSSNGRRDGARRTKHMVDVETERGAIPLLSGRVASRYFLLPLVIRYAPGRSKLFPPLFLVVLGSFWMCLFLVKFRACALPFLNGLFFSDSVFVRPLQNGMHIHMGRSCARGLSFVAGDIAATALRAPPRPHLCPVLAHRPPLPAPRPHCRS